MIDPKDLIGAVSVAGNVGNEHRAEFRFGANGLEVEWSPDVPSNEFQQPRFRRDYLTLRRQFMTELANHIGGSVMTFDGHDAEVARPAR